MKRPSRSRGWLLLPWLNLVIMLFPPIHLYLARGDMWMALLFFAGSSLFLIFSVFYLHYTSSGSWQEE